MRMLVTLAVPVALLSACNTGDSEAIKESVLAAEKPRCTVETEVRNTRPVAMGFKSGVLDMKPDSWTTLSSITEPALPSGQSRTLAPVAVPCGADLVVAVRARDAAGMFFDMKGLEARPTGAARAVFEIQDAGVVARWE